jgi:HEAT repeat protein
MTENALLDQKAEAVLLLARGLTSDKVGEQIGVNGRTVRRWLTDPAFTTDVRAARTIVLDEAVRALGAAAADAVAALRAALGDPSPSIRIRAAIALLSILPGFAEHASLDERITALEAAVEKGEAA